MAQAKLDLTGNEPFAVMVGKIQAMFTELYGNSVGGAGSFTTLAASGATTLSSTLAVTGLSTLGSAKLDTGTKTATASGGAATLNKASGKITSEALTTAAGSTYTLTLTDSAIAAADTVFASVALGTSTHGVPIITTVTPAAGSVVIAVQNDDTTNAFNGTIVISFAVLKA